MDSLGFLGLSACGVCIRQKSAHTALVPQSALRIIVTGMLSLFGDKLDELVCRLIELPASQQRL